MNVLAVMDAAIQRAAEDAAQYKYPDKDGDWLKQAREAVAELIEAAKKAQAMMAIPDRIEPRHRQELCEAIANCQVVSDPRVASCKGEK